MDPHTDVTTRTCAQPCTHSLVSLRTALVHAPPGSLHAQSGDAGAAGAATEGVNELHGDSAVSADAQSVVVAQSCGGQDGVETQADDERVGETKEGNDETNIENRMEEEERKKREEGEGVQDLNETDEQEGEGQQQFTAVQVPGAPLQLCDDEYTATYGDEYTASVTSLGAAMGAGDNPTATGGVNTAMVSMPQWSAVQSAQAIREPDDEETVGAAGIASDTIASNAVSSYAPSVGSNDTPSVELETRIIEAELAFRVAVQRAQPATATPSNAGMPVSDDLAANGVTSSTGSVEVDVGSSNVESGTAAPVMTESVLVPPPAAIAATAAEPTQESSDNQVLDAASV